MTKLPYMSLDSNIDEDTEEQAQDWFDYENENEVRIKAVANALPYFLDYRVSLSEGIEIKRGGNNWTYARIVRTINEGTDKNIADLFKELIQCAVLSEESKVQS